MRGEYPKIKICDYGSAKRICPNGKNTPYVVSRYYRAPELILAVNEYSVNIDVWSAGCILAEIILMKPLFTSSSEGDTLFMIHALLGSPDESYLAFYKNYLIFDTKGFDVFPQYP